MFSVFLLVSLSLIINILVQINGKNVAQMAKVSAAEPEYNSTESTSQATSYKFNFAAKSVPDFINVNASTSYTSDRKYGFNRYWDVKDTNDGVAFIDTDLKSNNTFDVDLANGLYEVKVTLGKNTKTSVVAEGTLQLINLTGDYASDTFQIPITDGKLNILATDGQGKVESEHSFSALEIKQISTNPVTRPTIWICGDSTSCNYYPKDSSKRTGMGQVLDEYIDTDYYDIKNLASSGQTAVGFVKSGQFETIEKYGKKDDYLIIAMGINDSHRSNVNEYSTVVTNMIDRTMSKKMNLFLVQEHGRVTDINPDKRLTDRWFNSTLKQIGDSKNLQVIDLFNISMDHFEKIGKVEANTYYDDSMHCNRKGALYMASVLAEQMNLPHSRNIANDTSDETDETKYETSYSPEGIYYIQNAYTNLYLDVENGSTNNGTNIQQWTQNKTDSQKFKIEKDTDGTYHILTASSNYMSCLDVENGSTQNGANIMQYKYYGGDMQKFKFEKNSNNTYTIYTKVSNYKSVLEVFNANKLAKANVDQWQATNSTNQQFKLIRVE